MKKLFSMILSLALVLALCPTAMADTLHIGISQFAVHGSLDNCVQGFKEGLAEEGFVEGENIVFDLQNANADTGIAAQIADRFVNGHYDLICAVATPVAMSCFNAAQDREIPVIYTAVSDPVAAQLANADGSNPGEVTGTSDALPVEAQLKLIRALQPDATRIGILHTTSETNSDSSLATYQALAPEYGFTIVDKGISTGADIPLALEALLPQVDCTTNLTDNTVVQSLPLVLEMSAEAGKPVYGSEIEQVRLGCVASEGIEYLELGRQTGRMAARVLKGEAKASEIPFEIISNSYLYINEEALAQYGLSVPEALVSRAISVTMDE
ncbi:MAG: ABC transporter substrate-binding protein [Clostridia bacterium]|nr:ABC transporter substrate-binding protein [Clostridia bacterium]